METIRDTGQVKAVMTEVYGKNLRITKAPDDSLEVMMSNFEKVWLKMLCKQKVGKRQAKLVWNFWRKCFPVVGTGSIEEFHLKVVDDTTDLERYLASLQRTHTRKSEVKVWRPLTQERPLGARRATIEVYSLTKSGRRIPFYAGKTFIGFKKEKVPGWATVEEVKSKGWVDKDTSWNPDRPDLYGCSEADRPNPPQLNGPDPLDIEEGWAMRENLFTEPLGIERVHEVPSPLMVANNGIGMASVITAHKCLSLIATT